MLDMRDISIINALPYEFDNILTVGCGEARIEKWLHDNGHDVLCTDIYDPHIDLPFQIMDIFKPDVERRDVVISSEVLEHLPNYKQAYKNLLYLTKKRLIVTVPALASYSSPDHINHWGDHKIEEFKDVPYSVSISKILCKKLDIQLNQSCYLVIVDKEQCFE